MADWFELDGDVHVTHVDGTGYYSPIHRFCERNGVPMVLNTSYASLAKPSTASCVPAWGGRS